MRFLRASLALVSLAASTACGGGSPSSPSAPTTPPPPPQLVRGAALSIVSGLSRAPIAGATVTINGVSSGGPFTAAFVSDGAGRVVLDRDLVLQTPALVDVVAAGHLSRNTRILTPTDVTLDLWPTTGGLSEGILASLVYARSSCPAEANPEFPLRRLSAASVSLILDAAITDGVVVDRHLEGAARLASAQSVPITVSVAGAPTGVAVNVTVDPDDPSCEDTTIGVSRVSLDAGGNITRASITYCQTRWARNLNTVVHELGHVAGLRHSPEQADVMYCYVDRGVEDFSGRERGVLRLMEARRSGNRWPDDDRGTIAASARTEVYACPALR